MKKILFLLLTIGTTTVHAMQKTKKPLIEQTITAEQFELYKNHLSPVLKNFVTDFATWKQEEKNALKIFGLNFSIKDLNQEKHAPYGGNIGYWIDCRTHTEQTRALLLTCLEYLQKKQQ